MKRKFREIETDKVGDECDNHTEESPIKSRKKRKTKVSVKSSLFKNKNDQKDFSKIFKSIEASELIQILNISHDINKSIAEYATGKLLECKNEGCGEIIVTLHQDCDSDGKIMRECPGCKKEIERRYCSDCDDYYYVAVDAKEYVCPKCGEDVCFQCQKGWNNPKAMEKIRSICDDPSMKKFIPDRVFEKCMACWEYHCKHCMKDGNECKCCGGKWCDFWEWRADEEQPILVVSTCSCCEQSICQNCMAIPEVEGRASLDIGDIGYRCVCKECFKKHKDIFKW